MAMAMTMTMTMTSGTSVERNKNLVNKDGEGSSKKLKKGDKVNISQILFPEFDFLIKRDGKKLYANHLNGKVIVLHFVPLGPRTGKPMLYIDTLVDVYNDTHHPIEVVFIGFEVPIPDRCPELKYKKSSEEYFQDIFSIMPWTAIPFSRTTISLDYWQTIFGYPLFSPRFTMAYFSLSFVINHDGVVLQLDANDIFRAFGAEAYPFSDEKVSYLQHQDEKALDCPSITQLLTSPGHDHVINRENKKVPVKDLEGKTVALYFYQDCFLRQSFDYFTKKLKDAYDDLMPAKKDEFEVVLVYIHHKYENIGFASKKSFRKALNGMPWLALRFKHPRVKNLQRIFGFSSGDPETPRLVIIGPHGNFVEPYGTDMLDHFGLEAYPFTRKEAVKIKVDKIKTLKLDMFLDPNTTFSQDGSNVKQSQFAGKKIILIVEAGPWYNELVEFWESLTHMFDRMNKMGDPFEVIHLSNKDTSSSSTVPWLRGPFPENSEKHKLVRSVFRGGNGLLAFDGDGTVVRKTAYPYNIRNQRFPFDDDGIEKETLKILINDFQWGEDSDSVRGF